MSRRIEKNIIELSQAASDPDNGYGIVNVTADDYSNVRVQFTVHKDSAYYSQLPYTLKFDLSKDYPIKAPKVSFLDRVYHPNITGGSICVDTLSQRWTPALSLCSLVQTIACLLDSPDPSSALNGDAARDFRKSSPRKWKEIVQAKTSHYCKKTVNSRKEYSSSYSYDTSDSSSSSSS
jgi:ubiquitin-protein ligase